MLTDISRRQSEMAPPKIRGFLVLFEGALITGGVMISYWLNYGFWFITQYGSFQWRSASLPTGGNARFTEEIADSPSPSKPSSASS